MFKEFFVFNTSGLCFYSWKSDSIFESTDSALIGGLLFAVSEFAHQAFRGRLQRLDLDNSKLIMTAQDFEIANPEKNNILEKKTLIFGALVDSRDNNHLIQEVLGAIGKEIISDFDYSGMKPMDKDKVDPIINNMLKKKTFSRKKYLTTIGIIISAIGVLLGSAASALQWQYFNLPSWAGFFDIVPVLLFSFGIIFVGAMFIGEKNKAIKLTVLINGLFSIFLFYVFQYDISKLKYFTDLGQLYTYVLFVILISFTSALFGSLLTERKFLFPE